VFEELLVLQLGLLRLKGRTRAKNCLCLTQDSSQEFFAMLPFAPTNAQRRAVNEAIADMQGKYPMNRLIQGDVGSGKTAVAAALCYCVIKCGMQAALMAPTEILAQQHYHSLSELLSPAGIHVALLTGSVTAAKLRVLLEQLKSGEIQLLIGTHAILSDGVEFNKLGLVVTDEQHRFGVAQRAALSSKGNHPHMLIMSATPIPRTLALMIYGDLDLSVLDELPPGRQKIETYAINSGKRTRAFRFLHNHIDAGQQCYIICPLIDEGQSDMASVQVYTDELREKWFPNDRIAMLHGKMKPKEKEAVMSDFAAGKIDILVSTTVVEVGVDVPNATVMLIENAERYGLSQLHQLRGRVGRGKVKSTCILVSDAQNEEAVSRLHVMCETCDGFRIADEDLRLRGPGDFFGARQHGLPELKIADMVNDMELLKQAQATAHAILTEDESLVQPNHRGLRAEVNQLFGQTGQQGLN
jgi:ATP-dependent DNA helicase RecG